MVVLLVTMVVIEHYDSILVTHVALVYGILPPAVKNSATGSHVVVRGVQSRSFAEPTHEH